MMGPSHRLLGALCGAVVGSSAGHDWPMVAMTAIVASTTAHGPTSPDLDQSGPWRAAQRLSGPFSALFRHRSGLSHWWGVPVAAWLAIGQLPAPTQWVAVALLTGWVSHLIGDFVFGRLHLLPWGGPSFGFSLRTDGFIEDGSVRLRGRKVTLIPFGPTRVVITIALAYVLWATPAVPYVPALIAGGTP